jgi:hypothetical protein
VREGEGMGREGRTRSDESDCLFPPLRDNEDTVCLVDLPHVETKDEITDFSGDSRPDVDAGKYLWLFDSKVSVLSQPCEDWKQTTTLTICLSGSPGCLLALIVTNERAMRKIEVMKPNIVLALRHCMPDLIVAPM